jgi:hypothetical protein
MRKKYLQKPKLTKKRFKIILAVLGLLAAWLIALSGLVMTSSLASAERGLGVRTMHASNAARKGAGTINSDPSGKAVSHNGSSKYKRNGHILCNDELQLDGWLQGCYPVLGTDTNSDMLGEDFSISTGSLLSRGGGNDQQDRNAGDFNFPRWEPLAHAFDGFSPFGLSSSVGALGGGTISLTGQEFSVLMAPHALAGINDVSKTGDESAPDISEGLIDAANRLANKNFLATFDNPDSPSMMQVNDASLFGESVLPINAPSTTQSVPEPLTLSMFAAALIGMMVMRSRKLKKVGRPVGISKVRCLP